MNNRILKCGISRSYELSYCVKELLAEDVTFWDDGGGKVKGTATRLISGRVTVAASSCKPETCSGARYQKMPGWSLQKSIVNQLSSFVPNKRAISVLTIEAENGHIQTIRIVANPDILARV